MDVSKKFLLQITWLKIYIYNYNSYHGEEVNVEQPQNCSAQFSWHQGLNTLDQWALVWNSLIIIYFMFRKAITLKYVLALR